MDEWKNNQSQGDQMQDIIRHFSARAQNYGKSLDWVNDENILDMIIECIPKRRGTILDLGAGTGVVAKYILKRCEEGCRIVALDICKDMLDQINETKIETICSGVEELPFEDGSFDVVVSRQCLHYVEEVEKVLTEVQRILKPNGVFILAQIVPFDEATSSEWESVIKIRQPLRKWYFTSEGWNELAERNSLNLQLSYTYAKIASVEKWASKYSHNNDMVQKYKQKLLSMNEEYKEKYAVLEVDGDIIYKSFWHIARYSKGVTNR